MSGAFLQRHRDRGVASSRRRPPVGLVALLLAPLLSACVVIVTPAGYERHGVWLPRRHPDPPAQGADRLVLEDDGREVELVFDDEIGLYRMTDRPGLYYVGGWFYRQGDSAWEIAGSLRGPWRRAEAAHVPPGLRALADDDR